MIAGGSSAAGADSRSYVALWGLVQQQAATISFMDTFLAMDLVFLAVLPFLFLMRGPKHHGGGAAMLHARRRGLQVVLREQAHHRLRVHLALDT